jgi:predicted nucleic acid-binding protein
MPPNEIAIPAVVIFELEVGIGKSTSERKRKAQLQELNSRVCCFALSIAA